LVRTWKDWLEAFETLVDGVLVAVDMVDFVVVVVTVVGLGFPQNHWKKPGKQWFWVALQDGEKKMGRYHLQKLEMPDKPKGLLERRQQR
jgi:hypothetical protein